MSSAHMDTVRYAIEEGWNKGNPDVLDEVYAPGCVSHDVSRPGLVVSRGVEAQKGFLRDDRVTFPDFHASIEDMFCVGDKVVFRWVLSGTQKGKWFGIAPTGKRIAYGGITICRFAENKIQEEWIAADVLSALAQLGALGNIRRAGEPLKLELLSHRGRRLEKPGGHRYVIEGQVKNVSDLTLECLEVVATIYDRHDRFLSTDRSSLPSPTLQPGQVSPFEVRVTGMTEPPRRYDLHFEREGRIVKVGERSGGGNQQT